MVKKTTDRRVRRTRRALEDALISLVLEEGYDAVTIEEITDRANLGRTTFYLHFRDKEELLMHAIDTIIEDFLAKHEEKHINITEVTQETKRHPEKINFDGGLMKQIFVHARDNSNLYKVILRGEGGAKATHRFTDISKNEFIRRLQDFPMLKSKIPTEVFAIYFANSFMQLVTWWLEEDQPYSIDEMVEFFKQLFVFGAMDSLGLAEIKRKRFAE